MSWNFNNERPIYLQIIDELIIKIVSGIYPLGAQLPSVRELASQIKVNPNTVQRAFVELERLDIIITQRTNGRFVTEDNSIIEQLRHNIAMKQVIDFKNNMMQLGFDDDEILTFLRKEDE